MNKVTLGIMAFLALAAICLAPLAAGVDATISHDTTDNVYKVESTEEFEIEYVLGEDDADKDLTYEAKVVNKSDETMSSAVSPSSGSLDSGESKTLTVTVPKDAGSYTLVVDYYLGSDDDKEKIAGDEFKFKAVNPITLKLNLKTEDVALNLEDYGVYFYIDTDGDGVDEKMDDSYTTITLASDGTGSVSYDWIADPQLSKYTFHVEAVGGSDLIKGLNEEHTFYAHDNDYTWIIVLAVLVLIILILAAVWVYRKPVKNFGKPKSRR